MTTTSKTRTLEVQNMMCPACEQHVEQALKQIPGIANAKANFASNTVLITFDDQEPPNHQIHQTLEDIDYPVVEKAPARASAKQWTLSIAIVLALCLGFALLNSTGVFNQFPMANQDTALPLLFIIGLLTSVHCLAMCGGISISLCSSQAPAKGTRAFHNFLPALLYNSGRVVSYTIVGAGAGALGALITPTGAFKGTVAILASIFMIIMGLNLLGALPFLRKLIPRLPQRITSKAARSSAGKGPFVVGLLNGLMPCGPLQAMQLYALSSGSALAGALGMFLFSLGTVPLMFALGAMSTLLSARFNAVIANVSALLVILLGLLMLDNGLALSGIALFV